MRLWNKNQLKWTKYKRLWGREIPSPFFLVFCHVWLLNRMLTWNGAFITSLRERYFEFLLTYVTEYFYFMGLIKTRKTFVSWTLYVQHLCQLKSSLALTLAEEPFTVLSTYLILPLIHPLVIKRCQHLPKIFCHWCTPEVQSLSTFQKVRKVLGSLSHFRQVVIQLWRRRELNWAGRDLQQQVCRAVIPLLGLGRPWVHPS